MELKTWIFSLIVFVSVTVIWGGIVRPVQAEVDGGKIVFKNTKSFPPVVFDHDKHKAAGVKCNECHDSLFKKQRGSTDVNNALTMKALRSGKYCGTCHDGSRAFSVRRSCKKCHQK